jgi:hypothetical protein
MVALGEWFALTTEREKDMPYATFRTPRALPRAETAPAETSRPDDKQGLNCQAFGLLAVPQIIWRGQLTS